MKYLIRFSLNCQDIRYMGGYYKYLPFECLAIFHRNRSLRLLREAFEKLGEERIRQVDEHFNTITTCGFTFEEIRGENLTLIKYPDKDQTRF